MPSLYRSRSRSQFQHMKTSFACTFGSHSDDHYESSSDEGSDRGRSTRFEHQFSDARSYSNIGFVHISTPDQYAGKAKSPSTKVHFPDGRWPQHGVDHSRHGRSHCRGHHHCDSHKQRKTDEELKRAKERKDKDAKDREKLLRKLIEEEAKKKAEERRKNMKQLKELEAYKKSRRVKHYCEVLDIDRSLAECDKELAELTKINQKIRKMRPAVGAAEFRVAFG